MDVLCLGKNLRRGTLERQRRPALMPTGISIKSRRFALAEPTGGVRAVFPEGEV